MPKILIRNNGQTIEASMVRSILVSLQMNEVPILTICGGRAGCGKCVIRVHSGGKFISPKQPHEINRLKAIGAEGEDMRLACQSYPGRDLEIEIINFGKDGA